MLALGSNRSARRAWRRARGWRLWRQRRDHDDDAGGPSPFTADPLPGERRWEADRRGWSGTVAGIGCAPAARLILHHFARDCACRGGSSYGSIRTANPAPFRSAGFECGSFPLEDGSGWHVVCNRDDTQISFLLHPLISALE